MIGDANTLDEDALDALIAKASKDCEQPPPFLFERINEARRARLLRRRFSRAAAATVLIAVGFVWMAKQGGRLVQNRETPALVTDKGATFPEPASTPSVAPSERMAQIASPAVKVAASRDVLIQALPTRSAHVHVFWLYPVVRKAASPAAPFAAAAQKQRKGSI